MVEANHLVNYLAVSSLDSSVDFVEEVDFTFCSFKAEKIVPN